MANSKEDDKWDAILSNADYTVQMIETSADGTTKSGIESGITKLQKNKSKMDPHFKSKVGSQTVKVAKNAKKGAGAAAIVVDAAFLGKAVYDDYQHGTTRNTVESTAGIAGGYGGAVAGAAMGAAAGTLVCPGIGTGIGAFVGGLGGGIGGANLAEIGTVLISDMVGYDIIEKTCKKCKNKFKVRKYAGEKDVELCAACAGVQE